MFDLDHTLVKPIGKKVHPKDTNDWEWLYPVIPKKLKELSDYIIYLKNNISTNNVLYNSLLYEFDKHYQKIIDNHK